MSFNIEIHFLSGNYVSRTKNYNTYLLDCSNNTIRIYINLMALLTLRLINKQNMGHLVSSINKYSHPALPL